MIVEEEWDDQPWSWIVRGGKPARCLGRPEKHGINGFPSYEHDRTRFVVMDLIVLMKGRQGDWMLLPRNYRGAVIRAEDGLVPLHDEPTAEWRWRPFLYKLTLNGWIGLGSQKELAWRKGLAETIHHQEAVMERMLELAERDDPPTKEDAAALIRDHGGDKWFKQPEAEEKAEELLREHLTPFQLLDWLAVGKFRVRGGATGKVYAVQGGDGFAELEPASCVVLRSYCLHTDYWMPDADHALALKLQLEDPELEEQTIATAREGDRRRPPRTPAPMARRIYDMEKEAALV